jgi:hypothetical protein
MDVSVGGAESVFEGGVPDIAGFDDEPCCGECGDALQDGMVGVAELATVAGEECFFQVGPLWPDSEVQPRQVGQPYVQARMLEVDDVLNAILDQPVARRVVAVAGPRAGSEIRSRSVSCACRRPVREIRLIVGRRRG